MPNHVVVDGSNLATEGRAMPSLAQLNDAVMAFIEEQPDALITVVVDATFGHRIDPSEVKEFDAAVSNNELVAPPAGAIGRGDAFVLSIANKVSATILSNDSFQEFHGTYPWLFDEGRLVGGKPVPHIGWVFVNRVPVRGPISRTAVKEARRKKSGSAPASAVSARDGSARDGSTRDGSAAAPAKGGKRHVSPEANQPMPVPKAPPPGAVLKTPAHSRAAAPHPAHVPDGAAPTPASAPKATAVNDLLPFLSFVEHHPLGTSVNATVESYSSHGAYVSLDGDVMGYLPLRKMAEPAPRSAREFLTIGDTITLVVESFAPTRRSIDLATVAMATAQPEVVEKPAKRSRAKKAAAPVETVATSEVEAVEETAAAAAAPRRRGGRAAKAAAPVETTATETETTTATKASRPTKKARGAASATAAPEPTPVVDEAPAAAPTRAKRTRGTKATAAPATVAAPAIEPEAPAPATPATKRAAKSPTRAARTPAAKPAKRTAAAAAADATESAAPVAATSTRATKPAKATKAARGAKASAPATPAAEPAPAAEAPAARRRRRTPA